MHWVLTPEQAAEYVARGFVHRRQDHFDWSAIFRRIGGGSCIVRLYRDGQLLVQATGTRRAIEYVEDTIRSLEPAR